MVKKLLQRLMREEQALHLEEHATKVNGYYTCGLPTPAGPVGTLKFSRSVREKGAFIPRFFPIGSAPL
ncbi:MAG: hypothetical protein QXY83_01165 [Thermosphaera sp.]